MLPSKNVTSPVAVPVFAATVAVKVTVSPRVMVADDVASVVLVPVEDCMYAFTNGGTVQTAAIRTSRQTNPYLREGRLAIGSPSKMNQADYRLFG